MNSKQHQVLQELQRQLKTIQPLDRIDRETIRTLSKQLERLFSGDGYESLYFNARRDKILTEGMGNMRGAR